MKLFDAMSLGFTLVEFNPDTWCGCAFGGAVTAVGRKEEFWRQLGCSVGGEWVAETAVVKELWPWITAAQIDHISALAWKVAEREATKEDILAYVRSIEPAAPSIFDLPDISLEEQHRMEEMDAESQSADLGGYPDPVYERNGR